MRAWLLALLEHRHRHLAESFRQLRRVLEQLPEADRAGEARRPGADDQDADLDPLVPGSLGAATNSPGSNGGGKSAGFARPCAA